MRKLRIALFPAAAALAVVIPVALALGDTSGAPSVSSAPAANVSASGATLNGSVNPNGKQTSYAFQWGPTNGYGHETPLTSTGAGTTASSVSANLTGLDSGSTYHFRVIAMSSGGTSVSSDETFTTSGSPPAPSPAPAVGTGSASNIGQSGATVSGTITPNGQATQYYFEYGPTANYGFETQSKDGGSGAGAEPVNADLSGLLSGTTYHYRLVAVSAGGTALGSDQTLTTTTPPTVGTGGASRVRSTSLVVNGTVNPRGEQTTYFFQYGTSATYQKQTSPASAGSGTSDVGVNALIGGLSPNTTYHYRLVASSAGGTSYGGDNTVVVGRASHVAFLGREGFVSPGRVIGVEAGCFDGVTKCTGHVALIHNGTVIGQRNFNIAANSGGFQNMQITTQGMQTLRSYNHVFHLLPVTVSVTETDGRKTSEVMHLSRWVWR
jgi:hypothetical protein